MRICAWLLEKEWETQANGKKVVSKQTKKKIWLMILCMNFLSTILTSSMLRLFRLLPTTCMIQILQIFFALKGSRKKHKHFHVENVWNYMWKHLLNCECTNFGICMAQLIIIKNSFMSKVCNNNVAWRQFSHAMSHCKKDGHWKFDMLSISSLQHEMKSLKKKEKKIQVLVC
jgi:hypothetical protein